MAKIRGDYSIENEIQKLHYKISENRTSIKDIQGTHKNIVDRLTTNEEDINTCEEKMDSLSKMNLANFKAIVVSYIALIALLVIIGVLSIVICDQNEKLNELESSIIYTEDIVVEEDIK